MKRFLIVGVVVIAVAIYVLLSPSTIRRTLSDWYNWGTIQIGGEIPPVRRLEHTLLRVDEYLIQLDEAKIGLAADIAGSEAFQSELEQIYEAMSKQKLTSERQGLHDRIGYFLWFRDQSRRLEILKPRIEQAIVLAKLSSLTDAQNAVAILINEVEKIVNEETALLEMMKDESGSEDYSELFTPNVTPSPTRRPTATAIPGVH